MKTVAPARRQRKPQENRTRVDGLPLKLQQQLLIACEAPSLRTADPAVVVGSNPTLFGAKGSDLHTRCRSKVSFYRKKRKNDIASYWELYRKAQLALTTSGPNEMPGTPRHGAGIPGMPGTLGNVSGDKLPSCGYLFPCIN